MTIWDCRTHVRMTSMTSLVERTDLDFKISVALFMIVLAVEVCIYHFIDFFLINGPECIDFPLIGSD